MSGGSFNYLCWHLDKTELGERYHDIQQMAETLEAMGDEGRMAARKTRHVMQLLQGAEDIARHLEDVWHAVEWWASCDWSEEQAREELRKYEPYPP